MSADMQQLIIILIVAGISVAVVISFLIYIFQVASSSSSIKTQNFRLEAIMHEFKEHEGCRLLFADKKKLLIKNREYINLDETPLDKSTLRDETVECANGHKYLLREFVFLHSTDITTQLVRMDGQTSRIGAVYDFQGNHVNTYSTGHQSVPVPVVSNENHWQFGCPSCRSSLFEFADRTLSKMKYCFDCNGLISTQYKECPFCQIQQEYRDQIESASDGMQKRTNQKR